MSLSPVKNRLNVGVESYVVFDAEGEEGKGDLFAGSSSGGKVFQLTFSRVHESAPALSPDGIMLAFIRGPSRDSAPGRRVWVMNLLNGAEREFPSPEAGAYPERVAWSRDGRVLYIRTTQGDYQSPAPPASPSLIPVPGPIRGAADTSLAVPLGNPVLGIAGPCEDGGGLCAVTGGVSQLLTSSGRDAFRWGGDSVAYFSEGGIHIRPLGGGITRVLRWNGLPPNPRSATQFAGVTTAPTLDAIR